MRSSSCILTSTFLHMPPKILPDKNPVPRMLAGKIGKLPNNPLAFVKIITKHRNTLRSQRRLLVATHPAITRNRGYSSHHRFRTNRWLLSGYLRIKITRQLLIPDMVCSIASKQLTKVHIKGPLGVRGRNSDNKLIGERLGWKPSQPLVKGLEKTYRWIEDQVRSHEKLNKIITRPNLEAWTAG